MESGPDRSGDFVVKAYQGGPARDDVVNGRGELTFAEQTRMVRGPVPGAERLTGQERADDHRNDACDHRGPRMACERGHLATPDDDPWYDVPPGPAVLPDVDTSAWAHQRR